MEYILIIVSLTTGFIISFLLFQQKLKATKLKFDIEKEKELSELRDEINKIEGENKICEARIIELREEINAVNKSLEEERKNRENAELEVMRLNTERKGFLEKVQELEKIKEKLEIEEKNRIELEKKYASLKSDYENINKYLEEEKKRLEEVKEQMQKEFKLIAGEILKQNSQEFSSNSKKDILNLVNPLKEKIETFEKKVDETYKNSLKDQVEMKAEFKKIFELSKQLDKDAKDLTKALKSDSKQQGNWGEVVLERILEQSGLVKDREYYIQETGKNNEGKTIRPDVIVRLPDNKYLIIDAKVSLTAYQEYIAAENEPEKQKALKRHIESVKRHVKELSEKNYSSFEGKNTPDFVLMFMPIEPAFATAIQNDHDIFSFAWEKKVVIVSPTTLLATLRTIESIWKQERQTRNALEIAKHAGSLYDKFVGFLTDLNKIGDYLDKSKNAYDDAKKKLSEGRGNIVRQVEKLKKLGAKTQKQIDNNLLED